MSPLPEHELEELQALAARADVLRVEALGLFAALERNAVELVRVRKGLLEIGLRRAAAERPVE